MVTLATIVVCLALTPDHPPADSSVPAALTAEQWVSIGPTAVLPEGSTGRVSDIAVDPLNANHWLIGASMGGVWQSLDAGASWTPLTNGEATQAIGAVAFHATDPNIIYAGTGEWWEGRGVLKSIDGGASWQLLGSSTLIGLSSSEVRVDPANPDTVLLATTLGFTGRAKAFRVPLPLPGIYRSGNGGSTWIRVLSGETSDLDVDPRSFSRQLTGVQGSDPNTRGVYRSMDGGQAWTRLVGPWSSISQNIRTIEMAVAPSAPDTVYVGITYQGTPIMRVWRSNDAWAGTPVWTQLNFSSYPQLNSDRIDELIVDRTNPSFVYIGGIQLHVYSGTSAGLITPPHVDIRTMAFAGTTLVSGDDGGVHTSTNGGFSWNTRNNGLSNTSFWDGAIHPRADLALGGVQDNGVLQWSGTSSWLRIGDSDGTQVVISRHDPDRDWAISTAGVSSFARTIDGGATFTDATSGGPSGEPMSFDFRFELCPADSDIMVLHTIARAWRSDDFFSNVVGPTWYTNGPNLLSVYGALAFAESDTSCSTYAAGRSSLVRLTTDGGATWTDLPATGLPSRHINDLAFDPRDPNALYVALNSFDAATPATPGHLFRTNNLLSGSPAFINVSPPMDLPINTVLLDPASPNTVFIGSDLGVWKSPDSGTTWTQMGPATGMPNVPVFDLQASPAGRIVAFTHGRGAYILNRVAGCGAGPGADADFDGVGNSCDNCPALANPLQADSDEDAEGDACDCDDADVSLPPDGDGDGFTECTGECDDTRDDVGPGAPQLCDGLNNDCDDPAWPDPPADEADLDGDGARLCSGDCDDSLASVRPGAPQICDGLNNDCNDPAWPDLPPDDADLDTDGFKPCSGDCDDTRAGVRPGGSQICGDGLNNDCSQPGWPSLATTNEGDDDADGFTECQADCNDAGATTWPGAPQICDGLNNDCSDPAWPSVPAAEVDGDGDGAFLCGDCDDTRASVHPGAPQICDGRNNDCSDPAWPAVPATEVDGDGDGAFLCGDCDDGASTVYPGAPQVCSDGLNNDCAHPSWPSLAGTNDGDGDGDGLSACAGDCNDLDPGMREPAGEVTDLAATHDRVTHVTTFTWGLPPGGASPGLRSDFLRSDSPYDFVSTNVAACLESDDSGDRVATDASDPNFTITYYLQRWENACPGPAIAGRNSSGVPKAALECP